MRDSDTVLYNIWRQTIKKDYKHDRIYRLLYNENLYIKAYSNIYANLGSSTKGTDESTADGFAKDKIQKLISSLKDETYQPKPARRTYIPKKDGNKRPLGIPSFGDRLVQEVCRMILEAIYEPNFNEKSHAFRPDRSCHTALKYIELDFRGVNWFIEGDIKGFYDNINHHILIDILREKISDERFIRLMWKFLGAGYVEDWKYNKTFSGTPQGGIISPILSNIYLNEFDNFIETYSNQFNKGKVKNRKRNPEYRKLEHKLGKLKKEILITEQENLRKLKINEYKEMQKLMFKEPYYVQCNKEYRRLKYIRYADDFLIGVVGSIEDCHEIKKDIKEFLNNTLKLELSENKTLITHSSDKAKFLSYNISVRKEFNVCKDKNGVKKRMYNRAVQLNIPKGTIERVIIDKKMVKDIDADKWDMLHRKELLRLSDLEIIEQFNAELRGIYNYFNLAENTSIKMWQLRYVMEYSCLKTLAGKHKTSVGKIKDKYSKGGSWGVDYQTKQGMKRCNFYDEELTRANKENKSSQVDEIPKTYKFSNLTELERRINADKCELCGIEGKDIKFHVHHIKRLKDLKGRQEWEIKMISRKRKTMIVCESCHRTIHKNDINSLKNQK